MSIKIAIDGPVAAGKTTTAKALAKDLGFLYVDTGALYRGVALYLLRNKLGPADCTDTFMLGISLGMAHDEAGQKTILNGEDVTEYIRTPEVSKMASDCSAVQAVRDRLLRVQTDICRSNDVVMEGRDIGTMILPDADVKFYLTADVLARAQRRFAEDRSRWPAVKQDPAKLLADLMERDANDRNRQHGPTAVAPDAVVIDNTNMRFRETVDLLRHIVDVRLSGGAQ